MKWTPQADGASPVIMVRSLPKGTTEQELLRWAEGFFYEPRDQEGRQLDAPRRAQCVKALVLHDRLLGFVQFSDIWAARAVMNQFILDPPSIVLHRQDGYHPLNLVYSDKPEIRSQTRGRVAPPPQPVYTNARLLLVVLKELSEAVTIDELFWTFTQIARVEKISSFTKDNKNQIVVQFEQPDGAAAALAYFNGKYLPSPNDPEQNLCFLAIVPSKLSHLTFRNQDGRNRDYTEVNRLVEALLASPGAISGNREASLAEWGSLCAMAKMNMRTHLYDFVWGEQRWGDGWLVPRQPADSQGRIPPRAESDAAAYTQGQLGQCMHISGLPHDDSITAGNLFRLCGMYGGVRAVKMLYKYRGCAVVQFADTQACSNAIEHLHALEFKGRTWDAKVSRQPNAMHWNGASDDLQKRMASSADPNVVHAPRSNGSAQRPTATVHLWDVPMNASADDVSLALTTFVGFAPTAVERLSLSEVACTFGSVDHAVLAGIHANGSTVALGSHGPWQIKLRFGGASAPPAAAEYFRMGQQQQQPQPQQPQAVQFAAQVVQTVEADQTTPDEDGLDDSDLLRSSPGSSPKAAAAAAAASGKQRRKMLPQGAGPIQSAAPEELPERKSYLAPNTTLDSYGGGRAFDAPSASPGAMSEPGVWDTANN